MVSPSMERLKDLSRHVALALRVLTWGIVPLIAAYVLLMPEYLMNHPSIAAANMPVRDLPPAAQAAAIGALTVASLPSIWGFWELTRLFENYAAGKVFTRDAAKHLRRCAMAVLLSSLHTAVGGVLLSAALSIGLPPGARSLTLSVSSNDLVLLLIGFMLIVIAHVMEEAARIAEENAGFF
ncbi:MAG: DUF2975 domain-containing protein [Rhodospirillaceae bacterium]